MRLIRWYYQNERALPGDRKAVYRLARATTRLQREAVDSVLNEFFILAEDGWHQIRCDEEIACYRVRQEVSVEKREHETERKRLYRERRSDLFRQLRAMGVVPA